MSILIEDWSPSEAEIAHYRRCGWLISPPFIPDVLLGSAWTAIERFLSAGSSKLPDSARASDLLVRSGAALDHVGYLALEIEEVRDLIAFPPLARAAARLAGTSAIRLFHDRLIAKPSGGEIETTIGWHIDRAYWFACTSEEMLTAWIPFDDVDASMGALSVYSGSHKRDLPLFASGHRHDMPALLEEMGIGGSEQPEVLVLEKGQVSFHHCRLVHGSLPNRSSSPRRALSVHLQPADNRHRLVILPNGQALGHTNDLLCRRDGEGHPDYGDPAAFPVLWTSN